MHGRLTSTHLVGRVAELAELELALAEAAARRPALVLLAGDSGIGKTRLLSEFERRLAASEGSPLVLRGEAVQTGDSELPYGPLLGALRPLVRERNEALSELAAGSRAQLAALLPGLDDGRGDRAERDDPSAQLRLFEALLELIDLLGAQRPVALILEDMHWADRSTRAFVAYLARTARRERLLALLSYRSDELHRRHPMRGLVAELERIERTRRLELSPFDRDELSEALTDILGERPADPLVSRLYARAEGNPLFTEELLAASLDGRGAAPQSLRDAFMLRIEKLSPGAQRAARVIAVGRALQEPVIAAVSGLEEPALQDALREAVAAQVLVPRGEDCLSFRHELLREALYDDLLPGERSQLHLALAQVLEERQVRSGERDLELAAGIAGHYASAGDQPAALRASVSAALAARAAHAAGEAARLAERALELWPRVPDAGRLASISHMDLVLLAGEMLIRAGNFTRAEQLLHAALDDLDPDGDALCYSAVLFTLARAQYQLNRGVEAVDRAKRALALLPESATEERADLLSWLARRKLLRGRFREALQDGEEALAAALAVNDRCIEADILNTLGMAQIQQRDVEGGAGRLREAIKLYEEIGDPVGAATAYANLAELLAIAGRTEEGLAIARDGLRKVPRHLRATHQWMVLTVSELAFFAGDWRLARANLGISPHGLEGLRLIFRLLRGAELALGEGDEDTAGECLEQAEPLVERAYEPQWIGAFGALQAELYRRRRDFAAARRAVAHALDRMELCTDDVGRIARVAAAGMRVESDIAQRARDLVERRDERDALARARLHMQRLQAAAADGGPVEEAWEATGKAELTRARGRANPAAWIRAADAWESVQRPYEVAFCRWRGAEAAAVAGDRPVAGELAASALKSAEKLGSRWLAGECAGLIRRARLVVESDGAGEPATAGVAAGEEDPFGLTAREREVLGLIAQGATNRQIGAALFMAEKTASVHVSRILAKLGVRSRTEAAAVAHRQGFTDGVPSA